MTSKSPLFIKYYFYSKKIIPIFCLWIKFENKLLSVKNTRYIRTI